MKKRKKLIKQIGRMTGKRLYTVHYTLLGRLVYHLCKLETKQLKNMVDNVINLSKTKRKTKEKPKRKTKRKFSAKQLKAQRLFAKRARAGTLKRRRR
jgi:CRISPR/Cas system endoribonuclease Cas6 (RAMP superfamily)